MKGFVCMFSNVPGGWGASTDSLDSFTPEVSQTVQKYFWPLGEFYHDLFPPF